MNKCKIWERGRSWERITKKTACKLYNQGFNILITACNIHPLGCMGGVEVSNKRVQADFYKLVNEFQYYNCNYECGKYAAFWREV
mgnify:CR=1 FL=1